jgi:hypothetical protein
VSRVKKSFPVVAIRLSPAPEGLTCSRDNNEAKFWMDNFISLPRGEVIVVVTDDPRPASEIPGFAGEAAWKRAYNLQKNGSEEPSSSSAICAKCALEILTTFGSTKGKAEALIIGAIASKNNLVLFDANFDRESFYPAVFHTPAKSLREFRIRYWSEDYEMLLGDKRP